MREIKFKGWDKNKEKMVEIRSIHFDQYGGIDLEYSCEDYLTRSYESNFKLMQYTGLKDNNDVEIYFDDIVKIHFKDPGESYRGTALIAETLSYGVGLLFDFSLENSEKVWAVDQGGVMSDLWEDIDLWDIEVIGNIYENPELLKK